MALLDNNKKGFILISNCLAYFKYILALFYKVFYIYNNLKSFSFMFFYSTFLLLSLTWRSCFSFRFLFALHSNSVSGLADPHCSLAATTHESHLWFCFLSLVYFYLFRSSICSYFYLFSSYAVGSFEWFIWCVFFSVSFFFFFSFLWLLLYFYSYLHLQFTTFAH